MQQEPEPITRPLLADEIAPFLRSVAGLPHWNRAQGEDAASLGRPFSRPVHRLDAPGWIAWALGGLHVFALPGDDPEDQAPSGLWVPRIQVAVSEARRVAVALAMLRHGGNLTHAANALGTSRRSLRGHLKHAGLYPWSRVMAERRTRPEPSLEVLADALAIEGGDGAR